MKIGRDFRGENGGDLYLGLLIIDINHYFFNRLDILDAGKITTNSEDKSKPKFESIFHLSNISIFP
jgi:hypothetical protein